MYIKFKYIEAIFDAIDFISSNVDGADYDKQERELLDTLRELRRKMNESQHKRLVNYYLHKKKKV